MVAPMHYGFNTRYHVTIPEFSSYKITLNFYILNLKGFLNPIIGTRLTAQKDKGTKEQRNKGTREQGGKWAKEQTLN